MRRSSYRILLSEPGNTEFVILAIGVTAHALAKVAQTLRPAAASLDSEPDSE